MSGILMSTPVGAMIDRTKGSAKNRLKCAGEHTLNYAKAQGIQAAGLGATTILSCAALEIGKSGLNTTLDTVKNAKGLNKVGKALEFVGIKMGKFLSKSKLANGAVNKLSKVFDNTANNIWKLSKKVAGPLANTTRNAKGQFTKQIPDWLTKIRSASKGLKAGTIITAAGLAATLIVSGVKYLHNAGKIDQKYTEKAKAENVKN